MGKLIHVTGNLLNTDANVIAHGVNCRGGFGSGVAGQVARQYPHVRKAYLDKFNTKGWALGEVQFVPIDKHQWYWVANMATQDTFGGPGVHADYPAIKRCFDTVLRFCEDSEYDLAIPKVGAGLAGGDWPTIEGIIRDLLAKRDVEVTCYSLPLPTSQKG